MLLLLVMERICSFLDIWVRVYTDYRHPIHNYLGYSMGENQHESVNMLIPTARSLLLFGAIYPSLWVKPKQRHAQSEQILAAQASYVVLGIKAKTRRIELDGPLHINTSGRKCLEANHCSLSKIKNYMQV